MAFETGLDIGDVTVDLSTVDYQNSLPKTFANSLDLGALQYEFSSGNYANIPTGVFTSSIDLGDCPLPFTLDFGVAYVAESTKTFSGSALVTIHSLPIYKNDDAVEIVFGDVNLPEPFTPTAQYDFTIHTKNMRVGPTQNSFGELRSAQLKCHYEDTGAFDVTLFADTLRSNTAIDVASIADTIVVNNQPEAGQPKFRNSIQAVVDAGMYGTHFSSKIVKKLPTNGAFKYNGVNLEITSRRQLGAEFIHGAGAINNGWE